MNPVIRYCFQELNIPQEVYDAIDDYIAKNKLEPTNLTVLKVMQILKINRLCFYYEHSRYICERYKSGLKRA